MYSLKDACGEIQLNSIYSLDATWNQLLFAQSVKFIGSGLIFGPLTLITLSQISESKYGKASAIFIAIRFVGSTIGVIFLAP